jgi:hypothetical protein
MFFGPNRIFLGFRITKNVGNLLVCFLDPVGILFLDLYVFVLDRGNLFFGCQINSFGARFLFFGPVDLFRGPCLQRMGGGNSIVIGVFIGLDIFGPWRLAPFFFNSYTRFFGRDTGYGEFRY